MNPSSSVCIKQKFSLYKLVVGTLGMNLTWVIWTDCQIYKLTFEDGTSYIINRVLYAFRNEKNNLIMIKFHCDSIHLTPAKIFGTDLRDWNLNLWTCLVCVIASLERKAYNILEEFFFSFKFHFICLYCIFSMRDKSKVSISAKGIFQDKVWQLDMTILVLLCISEQMIFPVQYNMKKCIQYTSLQSKITV